MIKMSDAQLKIILLLNFKENYMETAIIKKLPSENIKTKAQIVLGEIDTTVGELNSLGEGSILISDKLLGEPVALFVDKVLIAKGEVVTLDDKFGIRITDLV